MSYESFMEWYQKEYPYHKNSGERYNDMLSAWDAAVNNFPQESGSGQNSAELSMLRSWVKKHADNGHHSIMIIDILFEIDNSLPSTGNQQLKDSISLQRKALLSLKQFRSIDKLVSIAEVAINDSIAKLESMQ